MRSSKVELLFNEKGQFVGLFCQGAFCAEHEWGIEKLQEFLGINTKGHSAKELGMRKFLIQTTPVERTLSIRQECPFQFMENPKTQIEVLETEEGKNKGRYVKKTVPSKALVCSSSLMYSHGEYGYWKTHDYFDQMRAQWDEKGMILAAFGKDMIQFLDELIEAAKQKKVIVMLGNPTPNNPFSRSGLVVAIHDRIDSANRIGYFEAERDQQKLAKWAKKSGITKLIAKAEKKNLPLRVTTGWKLGDRMGEPIPDSQFNVMFFYGNTTDNIEHQWRTVEEFKPILKEMIRNNKGLLARYGNA